MSEDAKKLIVAVPCVFNDQGDYLLIEHVERGWCFPGGKQKPGESIWDAARRELLEETGLIVKGLEMLPYVEETEEWVCLYFRGPVVGGRMEIREPDKHCGLDWFPRDRYPENFYRGDHQVASVLFGADG